MGAPFRAEDTSFEAFCSREQGEGAGVQLDGWVEVRLDLENFGDGHNIRHIKVVLARGFGSRRQVTRSIEIARRNAFSQTLTHV